MHYVSRSKIFIQTVKKSPQGCSTSDLLSSKLKNQCEETFIDSLLLTVLITVTCYDSPALSLYANAGLFWQNKIFCQNINNVVTRD